MNFKKKFRVRFRNFIRKSQSTFTPERSLSETQQLAISVIKKAIIHPDAELLTAPISGTKYIHFNDVFIRIEKNYVNIINGSYSYHVDMFDDSLDSINRKFNAKLESTYKRWERTITAKTNKSLNTILQDLTIKN
jgi:hypothetical protein